MVKINFKDTVNNPSKIVTKMGNVTTVTLRGTIKAFDWNIIPEEVLEWIALQPRIELYEEDGVTTIYSRASSQCHPKDHYNSILGERIAESRTKYRIYKFLFNLYTKLINYYSLILYGHITPEVDVTQGILADKNKCEHLYRQELTHIRKLIEDNNHE